MVPTHAIGRVGGVINIYSTFHTAWKFSTVLTLLTFSCTIIQTKILIKKSDTIFQFIFLKGVDKCINIK